jgi:hypothetical protein
MFGLGRPRALDRNAKVRIMHWARCLGRRTEKGKAYGQVTAKTLAVLEALLWGFHNAKSGICFPSYERIGARKKSEDQPHAQLGYAPGIEMPRQIEAEREAVPIAGDAGPWRLPNAWRRWRSSSRQSERPEVRPLHGRGGRDAAHGRRFDETGP